MSRKFFQGFRVIDAAIVALVAGWIAAGPLLSSPSADGSPTRSLVADEGHHGPRHGHHHEKI